MGTIMFVYFAVIVLMVASAWIIFTKAGKPGWASIVPIYNIIVWLEIIGKPLWWIILFIIPVVNFVFLIWAVNLLVKSFGKGVAYTIGMIFIPFVILPLLAFGDAKYNGPLAKAV
jgi:hypothetical protein